MPFKSRAQLRTCYGQKKGKWDCNKWLKETESVCCLPEKKGKRQKSRCLKDGERIVGEVQVGPRGGKFFFIEEKDKRGKICTIKIYIPRSRKI